jgi:hypothetical protein
VTERRKLKKRENLIKNAWKHGILGIELPGDDKESMFYKDPMKEKNNKEKLRINQKRIT